MADRMRRHVFMFPCENLVTNFISRPSLPDITPRCHAMLHLRKTMFLGEGDMGVYGIELFFLLFFSKGPYLCLEKEKENFCFVLTY